MKLYNDLGREKQEFKPLEEGKVKMYYCGPTVYAMPHIGNFRAFFTGDLLRRYLEFAGYDVKYVMNLTDIDDKTIRDSETAGMTLKEFTEKYTNEFFRGLKSLNIKNADEYTKATEHVPQMIELIEKLVEKGIAYQVGGSVYFSINKFPDYGKLSQVDLENLDVGHRIDSDEYGKDDLSDFVLWKASSPSEIERGIFFESPWGKGRPGWHIECSAMSREELGQPFDIHGGGIDLLFPHHENEIAQSEAAYDCKMCNYWVHNGHLVVDNQKMSKSKGNFFTLDDLIKKFSVNTIRYFFLSAHYKDKLNYTEQSILNAEQNMNKIKNALKNLDFALEHADSGTQKPEFAELLKKQVEEFKKVMDNDLDTPGALRVIHELTSDLYKLIDKPFSKEDLALGLKTLRELLSVLGLFEESLEEAIPQEVLDLVQEREKAREDKDWSKSDEIRNQLNSMGYDVLDSKEGTQVRKK